MSKTLHEILNSMQVEEYGTVPQEETEQQIKALMLTTAKEAGLIGHDYTAFEDKVNSL